MESRGESLDSSSTREVPDLIVFQFTDFWLGYASQCLFLSKASHLITTSDQFCSLIYSLSNLYFVGCFYTRYFPTFSLTTVPAPMHSKPQLYAVNATSSYQPGSSAFQRLLLLAYDPGTQEAWSTCGAARNWGWYYLLGVSPFVVRFVQSLRRYRDSGLPTHLINVRNF